MITVCEEAVTCACAAGDVGAGLEVDLDDAAAVVGLALDMLDAADGRRQRALVIVDDPPDMSDGDRPL